VRVGLAGGESTVRVVIRLSDTYLQLVSVRPNRRYLRGAYGLSSQRLCRGGLQYPAAPAQTLSTAADSHEPTNRKRGVVAGAQISLGIEGRAPASTQSAAAAVLPLWRWRTFYSTDK
jgi:hypothetical protein